MTDGTKDVVLYDHNRDGVDRRGFLTCMAWAGTGLLCVMNGGVFESFALGAAPGSAARAATGDLAFVQISDSHMGFNKAANPDVAATLQTAIDRVNALPVAPEFVLHTGDISHLSKTQEFDTVEQMLKGLRTDAVHYVPGEHDVLTDNGREYRQRFAKGSRGNGWYSFEQKGVHFIALVNVMDLKAGGLGLLGREQLEWLENDVRELKSSTPIVVFAHIPLWSVYPDWGWGTDDAARALSYLKRFGSVTVLNGHIHQTMQKIEGNVTFHTAMSTAFPQPSPGSAPSPGPMAVPAEKLRSVLGITEVNLVQGSHALAVVDHLLESATEDVAVTIDNFSFTPASITVAARTTVVWTNRDDVPHTVTNPDKVFSSPALDTGEKWSYTFKKTGTFEYFCAIHPKMTGRVIVQ
jgi:plastocyanin